MHEGPDDPYAVLGLKPDVSDEELRRVYRGLVKRHHPDHNGGSAESTVRFAEIQAAYGLVVHLRHPVAPAQGDAAATQDERPAPARPEARATSSDPTIDQRIFDLERELAATREAERRAKVARAAARPDPGKIPRKPTREELGYYETDDSFAQILDDTGSELSARLKQARGSELRRRLTDLFGR